LESEADPEADFPDRDAFPEGTADPLPEEEFEEGTRREAVGSSSGE
jgi:hypothetical protein